MLDTTDSGNATSTTGTNFAFDFISNVDQDILLDFDFAIQALAFVSPDSEAPSSATAGVSWNVFITDGVTTQSFAPADMNLTSSRNDIFTGLDDKNNAAGHQSLGFALTAGTLYQVGITHQVQVNAVKTVAVPEPGILALLGLGLAGFAVVRRRKV